MCIFLYLFKCLENDLINSIETYLFSTLSTNTPLPSYAIHNPVTTSFDPTKVNNLNNTVFFLK